MKAPIHLRCEHLDSPLGIDLPWPRFSWYPTAEERGTLQAAYQVICSKKREAVLAEAGDLWDSRKVSGERAALVRYDGAPLESFTGYFWRVRTWDQHGRESPWSDVATFETAALSGSDWSAPWITMREPSWTATKVLVVNSSINKGGPVGARLYWAIYLRHGFTLSELPVRARAYSCGLGYHELYVNGVRLGENRLDPGQTEYTKGALYTTTDALPGLRVGGNVMHAILGNGRYVDAYGYGKPRLSAFLLLEFADGRSLTVSTSPEWRCAHGPIKQNGIYEGEHYDARDEHGAWDDSRFDDSGWQPVETVSGHPLSSQLLPPIAVRTELSARALSCPRPGAHVFDFGQNLTGVVRLRARGPRGTTVEIRFAELLNDDGNLNRGTNREAGACDTFILRGDGEEVFEPRFTYHGFRYAEVTGLADVPMLDDARAVVIHTAVAQTGSFLCSDQLVNRIHENVLWGQRSNLMSAPTDCPQRGERMGWLGDAQLASEEAMYNFDMAGFYTKYLEDIRRAQAPDGGLSDVIPTYWSLYPADPAWGTAYPTLVWALWEIYGDKEAVKTHYDGVKRYADYLFSKSEKHIIRALGKYGDWCPPASTFPKKTPIELTSTFYYYHDTLLVSRMAELLGRKDDQAAYADRARQIKEAFNGAFLLDGGRYATLAMSRIDTQPGQTSQVLPLWLDMVPAEQRDAAVAVLLQTVEEIADYHVDTGIVGARYLFEVLRDTGHAETAYRVATQKTYPGWGYMIGEGATTIWERWEKLAGQGMNSHNHIMFGTIDAWFYRTLAGLIPTSPAWRTVLVQPWTLGGLTHAAGRVTTPHGALAARWERTARLFTLRLDIPVGVTADVRIPQHEGAHVLSESGVTIWGKGATRVEGLGKVTSSEGWLRFEAGSGSYELVLSA